MTTESPYVVYERVPSLSALLRARTPRLVVTPAIILIDTLIFAAMAYESGTVAFPPATLIAWGGQVAPAIAAGEWWRLLTAIFLHGHPLHLVMNMIILWQLGSYVERLLGPRVFAVVYLLAGVLASLVSMTFHSGYSVSVGASGAIFGLAGILLAIAVLSSGGWRTLRAAPPVSLGEVAHLPREPPPLPYGAPPPLPQARALGAMLGELRQGLTSFVVLNVIIGLTLPRVDNAAHLGGLVAGVGLGWMVGRHSLAATPSLARTLIPLTLTLALAWAAIARVSARADVLTEQAHFEQIDAAAEAAFGAAVAALDSEQRQTASMAAAVAREIRPSIAEARKRAEALRQTTASRVAAAAERDPYGRLRDWRHLPGLEYDRHCADAWATYLRTYEQGWDTRLRGLATRDVRLGESGVQVQNEALRTLVTVLAQPRPADIP